MSLFSVGRKLSGFPRWIFAISLFMSLMALCGSPVFAQTENIKKVDEQRPIAFEKGKPGRISQLTKIKTQTGARIGELREGPDCKRKGYIVWDKKLSTQIFKSFGRVFRAELEKLNYPVPVVSEKIFDDQSDKEKKQTALQVGIFLKEVNASFCTNPKDIRGGVYLKVFWQVFSPEVQKVVFETTSEGSYQPDTSEKSIPAFFNRAFAQATRNMLSDKGFYDTVTKASFGAPPPGKSGFTKLVVKGAPQPDPQLKDMDVTKIRSSVATIINDKSTGSGFFISRDGYLLTNQHVVKDARYVKVKTATGRELVGEVIRSDEGRDAALVKTEPLGVEPLAIRKTDVNIGEDVYAIGSPLGHTFNATLTRGILSGYRTINNYEFLQSDVTILPGNSGGPLLDSKGAVIGITVKGVVAKGFSGMNFFIPIRDAVGRLEVRVE